MHASLLEPLRVPSLKEACIQRLEELILSGDLKIGERLPPEREFAVRLGVSRPVLHEALVDLDAKGLVRIVPRRGVFVNDYRRSGSMAILTSLLAYHNGQLDPAFAQSLLDTRLLLEVETARLAALHRTDEHLREFRDLLAQEQEAACCDPQTLTGLDFDFHLLVAIASGNLIYPLLINSFKSIYTSLTGAFFRQYYGSPVVEDVHRFHRRLVEAIERRDAAGAVQGMRAMLAHGETYLKGEQS